MVDRCCDDSAGMPSLLGRRVAVGGKRATVLFVGRVPPTKGCFSAPGIEPFVRIRLLCWSGLLLGGGWCDQP